MAIKNLSIDEFKNVNLDWSLNPRQNHYIKDESFKILKDNIRQNGYLPGGNAGYIELSFDKETGIYTVEGGFHRTQALLELINEGVQFKRIKVEVSNNSLSEEERIIRHMISNSGRTSSDYDLGYMADRLYTLGWKLEEIASKFGREKTVISSLRSTYKKLSKKAKDAFKDGTLNTSQAKEVAKLDAKSQETVTTLAKEAKESGEKFTKKDIQELTGKTKKVEKQDKQDNFMTATYDLLELLADYNDKNDNLSIDILTGWAFLEDVRNAHKDGKTPKEIFDKILKDYSDKEKEVELPA